MGTIQLVQFVLVFFHAIQPIFFECQFPRAASLMFAGTGLQYFILFMMFYKKTYSKKESSTKHYKKTDSSNEQLEGLGNAVEEFRRGSLKVEDQVRRNSVTATGRMRRNSVSSTTMKESDKLEKVE